MHTHTHTHIYTHTHTNTQPTVMSVLRDMVTTPKLTHTDIDSLTHPAIHHPSRICL